MFYTQFGQTGVTVSRVGFGGMRFERPDQREEMAEIVWHAFDRGITYFDTAPNYCDELSEQIYGIAFKEMKKTGRPFYVSTKTMASKPDEIRRQCEESLEILQVDAIDFYHVWCLVHPEDLPNRKAEGALDAFRKLKEEGLIRHICVSTHLEHDKIAAMLDQGEGLFEGMLIGLNALNCHLRLPGAREAARRGMGVVTMNTLGGGLLTEHANRFPELMRPGDRSIVEAALRFNLSLPEVTVALVGFRSMEDVDEACDAVERMTLLDAKGLEAVQAQIRERHREFCTQCGYCAECPAGVPVVRLMDAYNRRLLEGPQAALDHMRWHWWSPDIAALIDACTQCRHCEEVCTQQLPVLERFETLRQDYLRSIKKSPAAS
ncbi:MAG TPA: aldo/keto reductase [Candidatus Hydrogenedentes bacterium]|nr:aldo/keto reductase [Candidatus Hydrogenedentota bacterium]HPU96400.1 aldo/keto reductase [Candidatus Hydrogenedentota bacterium]